MYRLIAADLDGTLLSSDKQLSAETSDELNRAFKEGAVIVPATGRILAGLPDFIKDADWFRYCIFSNGAEIYDAIEDKVLFRSEIPAETAADIIAFADTLPVLYDIYAEGRGFMNADMLEATDSFIEDLHYREMIHLLRTPVADLRSFVLERGEGVQKVQFYFRSADLPLREQLFGVLEEKFPSVTATSSVPFNIEINACAANKGDALASLCEYLGIPVSDVMAFGDNSNDISMLRTAGLGVCMYNGTDDAKAAADLITDTNDRDGVAKAIREHI